jgi:hypothetical protein
MTRNSLLWQRRRPLKTVFLSRKGFMWGSLALPLRRADAVGLSTIPEVIAAVHGGMAILGLSVITNMNLPDDPQPCRVDDIIATAEGAAPRVQAVIEGVIERLPETRG